MKKKRVYGVSLLLAVLMVLLSFSGCSEETKRAANELLEENRVSQTEPEPVEEVREEVDSGRPTMWQVTAPYSDNTIYLFGSIHAAEETLFPLDREILDVFEACDSLAVEVDVLAYTEDLQKAMELSTYMVYTDGSSITDEIDEELVRQVQELLEAEGVDLGVPMELSEMFRPYTFISLLSNLSVEKAGLTAEQGVDMYFLQLARDLEMEILEIESMESQLEMFNEFSPAVQTYLLEEGLQLEAAGEGVRELYNHWKRGDLEALAATLTPVEEANGTQWGAMEEYNQALLTDRNLWMSDVAEDYLQEGKTVFYVVGALHMVGDDGIVQQLTDRGYLVTVM